MGSTHDYWLALGRPCAICTTNKCLLAQLLTRHSFISRLPSTNDCVQALDRWLGLNNLICWLWLMSMLSFACSGMQSAVDCVYCHCCLSHVQTSCQPFVWTAVFAVLRMSKHTIGRWLILLSFLSSVCPTMQSAVVFDGCLSCLLQIRAYSRPLLGILIKLVHRSFMYTFSCWLRQLSLMSFAYLTK